MGNNNKSCKQITAALLKTIVIYSYSKFPVEWTAAFRVLFHDTNIHYKGSCVYGMSGFKLTLDSESKRL